MAPQEFGFGGSSLVRPMRGKSLFVQSKGSLGQGLVTHFTSSVSPLHIISCHTGWSVDLLRCLHTKLHA